MGDNHEDLLHNAIEKIRGGIRTVRDRMTDLQTKLDNAEQQDIETTSTPAIESVWANYHILIAAELVENDMICVVENLEHHAAHARSLVHTTHVNRMVDDITTNIMDTKANGGGC